jgi:hypothetical protein
VVQRGNFWLPLVFLCLVACEKRRRILLAAHRIHAGRRGEDRRGLAAVPEGRSGGRDVLRGARTYFGRTAFRPKALSAVTAPFAGRVAEVLVEPGQRVRAGAPLFALESGDVLQAAPTSSRRG